MVNEPLVHRLKFIQAAVKMTEATVSRYGEFSGRFASQGILHHLEDVGSVINPTMEVVPFTFGDEHLLDPSLRIVATCKVFQGA
ncbi:hypothetical protein GUJ93_ZPchr0012g20774 [Zizania palustris]|uniref:Uncharacterized protein n=1 Tax=Zizania palustris TaxID=103762 RepID=A0A8J6BPJ1_ZIZPA|nr:hypothetical protein GUJ93_ZPchr0012g20774 [Zizania palustris]